MQSLDLIKKVEIADDSKHVEDDMPSSKRICLSPSITQLPSSIHDSPAMPVPSSSHDPSVASPQSSSGDLPVKLQSSPQEHPATPLNSSSKDSVSSPSSNDLPATPPKSLHASIKPVNSHDSAATPPQSHNSSDKPHSSPHDTIPTCSGVHEDTSLPSNCQTGSSPNSPPPAIEQQDQLEFSDPTSDIINTQLNQQITDVQHFLKTDRLKRTKLLDTNTVQ